MQINNMYDIVIIGGGVMGCSTAYNLISRDNGLRIAVLEMDPTYARASSTLSFSNVRINFSLKENIQISQYTLQVLDRFEEEMAVNDIHPCISWKPEGNLFLFDEEKVGAAREALKLQQALGCSVEWLSPQDIKDKYPLYNLSGVVGGTLGKNDGYLDGYSLLMGYRSKAKSLGVRFIHAEVGAIKAQAGQIQGVELVSGERLRTSLVVNCAGAWGAKVAQSIGIKLPVAPTKRQVFVVDPAVKLKEILPLTVWPSGICFRSETGGLILVGKGLPEDPVGFDFSWDDKRFSEILWPELAQVVPSFDTLKLMRGWAGLYAINTIDSNAILGEWSGMKGLYLANGFSGHGLQQAPAVGRYLSELILDLPLSLDLSIFGPKRILEEKPIKELGIV
ncbi:MAG: FAD-binding oxidoreductase [Nitrospina sp.]|jgi:FAD-dependent oxidoreductase domain-containing protein 1|nr:FAD-binding oxidoreductase [Nitrospina sp.]